MTTNDLAPRKLSLLPLSMASVPAGGRTLEMVLGCYLVETGDGKRILVDSGPAPDSPRPAGTPPAQPGHTVLDRLADLGLRPDDVDLLVCTHFDVDHAGYHDAFTRAELVVQREHYEMARSGHPRYAAARPHWDHPGLRYRLVEGSPDQLTSKLRGDSRRVERGDTRDQERVGAVVGRIAGVREVVADGRVLRLRADDAARALPVVLGALDAAGVRIRAASLARPSLDDVYLCHVGRAFAADNQEVIR